MSNEDLPSNSEGEPLETSLYKHPDVIGLAAEDPRLANFLHGLELADQGRQISDKIHSQMADAVTEYLQQNYPSFFESPPPDESTGQ